MDYLGNLLSTEIILLLLTYICDGRTLGKASYLYTLVLAIQS